MPIYPDQTGNLPHRDAVQGHFLVAELKELTAFLQTKPALSKEEKNYYLGRENILLYKILQERERTGILPDGLSIHQISYGNESEIQKIAPELQEYEQYFLPRIRYRIDDQDSDRIPSLQMFEFVMANEGYRRPVLEVAAEIKRLLRGLPQDVDTHFQSRNSVDTELRNARQFKATIGIYFAKFNKNRATDEMIRGIRDLSTLYSVAIGKAIASAISFGEFQPYVFEDGNVGRLGGEFIEFSFGIPDITRENDTIFYCPETETGLINFLRRVSLPTSRRSFSAE